eukprot:PLAT3302.42.p1 GENE.PLAT3302.42~~PLAT3302.42.p1  ORF type:complete len:759 (+),score=391.94 PLAT3302.42:40-2316(+)
MPDSAARVRPVDVEGGGDDSKLGEETARGHTRSSKKGFCGRLWDGIRWRRGRREKGKVAARSKVRSMVNYIIFLTVFTIAAVRDRNNQDLYYFGEQLLAQLTDTEIADSIVPNHLKTYMDVGAVEEIWMFLRDPLYRTLYTSNSYDGDDSFGGDGERGLLSGQIWLLGGVRISQVRTAPIPCQLPPQLLGKKFTCYAAPRGDGSDQPSAYGDRKSAGFVPVTVDEPDYTTLARRTTYPPPNFVVELPPREANGTVAATLAALEEAQWINRGSRVVYVDINAYNANLDYMCLVRLAMELPTAGGVIVSSSYETLRLFPLHSTSDIVYFSLDAVLLVWVLIYIYADVKLMYEGGFLVYWRNLTNFFHMANLMLFLVVYLTRVQALLALPTQIDVTTEAYLQLRPAAALLHTSASLNSFNAFLSWIKLFSYLAFIPKFGQLTQTMSYAAGDIWGFSLIFLLVMFACSLPFMMAFGTKVFAYRTLSSSFFGLLGAMMGELSFEELRQAHRTLGPVFYISFVVLLVFTLVNVFVAIVLEAYTDAKTAIAKEDMGVESLSREVVHYVLHDVVFKLPLVGTVARRVYDRGHAVAVATREAAKEKLRAAFKADPSVKYSKTEAAKELARLASADGKLKELLDTDADGALGVDEIKDVLDDYDADHDGELDYDELAGMIAERADLVEMKNRTSARDGIVLARTGAGEGSAAAVAAGVSAERVARLEAAVEAVQQSQEKILNLLQALAPPQPPPPAAVAAPVAGEAEL